MINVLQEEETFWMERQLSICQTRCRAEVNVGTEVINEVLLYCHDQISQLELNVSQSIVFTMIRSCFSMLNCHHEYRQMGRLNRFVKEEIDKNVAKAVPLLMACFDRMDRIMLACGIESAKIAKWSNWIRLHFPCGMNLKQIYLIDRFVAKQSRGQ